MQGERVTRSITEEMHKAAVLVASLDRDVADELLQQMDPCQADSLRQAMLQLPRVDAAEERLAIQDFLELRAHGGGSRIAAFPAPHGAARQRCTRDVGPAANRLPPARWIPPPNG